MMKILLASFIIIFCFTFTFTQEKPKSELFNEFGMFDCCNPTFEVFHQELLQTNSVGYIVIYKNKNNPIESYGYEVAVKMQFLIREAKNIYFIQGKSEETTRTELWKVPQGAEKPTFNEEKWDYSLPNTKPFLLLVESEIDGICSFSNEMYINNILSGNKTANFNFVIYTNSQKEFLQKQKEIKKDFFKYYKVEPKRLKFFRKTKGKSTFENVEYWLVPKTK